MTLYVGTYSDRAIVSSLKINESPLIIGLSDDEIIEKVISNGMIKDAFAYFYANSLAEAIDSARSMDIKNFAPVSDRIYMVGVDY